MAGAEAERAARVGIAQAMATEEQVRAYGGPRYQLTQQVMARFAEAIEHAGVDVVPKVVIGGRDGRDGSGEPGSGLSSGGSVLEALLAILLSERVGVDVSEPAAERSPAAIAVREELTKRLASSTTSGTEAA